MIVLFQREEANWIPLPSIEDSWNDLLAVDVGGLLAASVSWEANGSALR